MESPGKLSVGVEGALEMYMVKFQGWDVHMAEDGNFRIQFHGISTSHIAESALFQIDVFQAELLGTRYLGN